MARVAKVTVLVALASGVVVVILFGQKLRQANPLQKLPKADPGIVFRVHEAADWRNPFIVVHPDFVEIRGVARVPADQLGVALAALPRTAWPYGRIVAVSQSGPVSLERIHDLDLQMQRVLSLLAKLGVEVNNWPSA